MPGPLSATGAISNPTRFGALNMGGEQFTGLWTQAGPYRDAATAYLIRKFYQGSRFDRIIDGLNREISVRLTDQRRPGSTVFNSQTFPAINSYYAWKYTESGAEAIQLIVDGADGNIYGASPSFFGGKVNIFSKSGGAGPARFLSFGNSLYFGDGVDQKKVLNGGTVWAAATNFSPGTLLTIGVPGTGTVQMALGGMSLPVVASACDGAKFTLWINPELVPEQFPNLQGGKVTFSGLTAGAALNGNTYVATIVSSTDGILQVTQAASAYGEIADAGTGSTGNGISGGSTPAFSRTQFAVVADGGQQWKCYGPVLQNWGAAPPTTIPTIAPLAGTQFWQPNYAMPQFSAILDSNGNVEQWDGNGGVKTGRTYPVWKDFVPGTGPLPVVIDGQSQWQNLGPTSTWAPATDYNVSTTNLVIIDSNGNFQFASTGGISGSSAPTWATTPNAHTTDGSITWTCLGAGTTLTTASLEYGFSLHAVDGSVTTSSPAFTIQGPIVGAMQNLSPQVPQTYLALTGQFTNDAQFDQIWIWRTPQGESILVLEDQIPIDAYAAGGTFTYNELAIPDTSTNGQGALNALIAAPVADANDPPPAGLTGMVWYLQRAWGFVGNKLYYSGGPDTIVGNGATAWPPANVIPFIGAVVKVRPITVQNGGLLVYTTSGIQIMLGTGTASNPFYDTIYCDKVNLGGYNVEDVIGSVIYLMEANAKVSSLTVQYPFNPQSGYAEVGLPIGDQFRLVTTGGISAALYNPATAYLSWCVANTQDTGMYVADGNVGWFRMSAVSPPESGLLWSPRAAITGGTSAVQSIETSPGVYSLLIGPPAGTPGPILMRDTTGTAWGDNGTAYDAYDTKGVNLLCSTGQWTEVAHISAKSAAVGARPIVSVLLNEIAPVPTQGRSWDILRVTGPDPVRGRTSKSVYADRYDLAQNAIEDLGDCILTKFDYGTQAVADELLDWGIYASTEEERKEEAQK